MPSHPVSEWYLLATYTNEVKSYCDEKFFERFASFPADKIVVDNSANKNYATRLSSRRNPTIPVQLVL